MPFDEEYVYLSEEQMENSKLNAKKNCQTVDR